MTMQVREAMRADLEAVSPSATLTALERLLTKQRISGVPVVDGQRIVGVVSRTDIVKAAVAEQAVAEIASDWYHVPAAPQSSISEIGATMGEQLVKLTVADVMTREVIAVAPDDALIDAIKLMASKELHRVLVVAEGKLAGILTSTDVLRVLAEGKSI
jgi:CBS domain-containing protein